MVCITDKKPAVYQTTKKLNNSKVTESSPNYSYIRLIRHKSRKAAFYERLSTAAVGRTTLDGRVLAKLLLYSFLVSTSLLNISQAYFVVNFIASHWTEAVIDLRNYRHGRNDPTISPDTRHSFVLEEQKLHIFVRLMCIAILAPCKQHFLRSKIYTYNAYLLAYNQLFTFCSICTTDQCHGAWS